MATIEQVIADLTDFVNAEGCEYCKHTDIIAGESSIDGEITADLRLDVEDYNSLDVIVYRDGGTLFGFSVDIKYCPMCGRRLEVERNG